MNEEKNEKDLDISVFRPGKEGMQKMLGTLEAQIMNVLWETENPLCVQDVVNRLQEKGKSAAYTTIMTTMGRLHAKGLLSRDMQGRAYYYQPRVSQRELTSNVTRQVIDGLLSTFAEPAIAYFVEALSDEHPDKLKTLAEMIQKQERKDKDTKTQES